MRLRVRSGSKVMLLGATVALVLTTAGCGSSGSKTTSASTITVHVTAPADGSTVRTDRITVRGTVTPPGAAVQVVGESAQVGNGVFTTSVALHAGRNTIDVVASAAGLAPATTTITITRAGSKSAGGKPAGGAAGSSTAEAPPLAGPTDCGGGLTAGAHTSCAFAQNVRSAYNQTGSGVLDVASPVTGQTYRMYCTSGSAHVCTGGNNASVYFGDAASYDTGNCGGGTSVGPNTSCGFARNVRSAYERSGSSVVTATSPTTGRTYTMYCTSGSPHVCTGGNNAAVYFP